MAVTFRNVIDRALVALGEDELLTAATSLSTKYEKLVGGFVNQIKEEIEDAWNWRALRQTHSATILAAASSGTVTNANERSRIVRVQQAEGCGAVPLAFDVTDATNAVPLTEIDLPELLYRLTTDTTQVPGAPSYFALDNSSADALTVRVFPIPSTQRTLSLTLITPQARLGNSDLATNILIPNRALEIGVIWALREERGEELGPNAMFSEQRYRDAISAAISRDSEESGGIDIVLT